MPNQRKLYIGNFNLLTLYNCNQSKWHTIKAKPSF